MPRLIQDFLRPLIEYKKWKGIDNLATDDMRIPKDFVRSANNVDIDSEDMMHMREGILQELLSGDCQVWGDGNNLGFFVKDGDLYQLNSVYQSSGRWYATYTSLLADVGSTKMNFVPVGHKIFFSNLLVNGYIEDGVAYAFSDVDSTIFANSFKTRMPVGSLIEYFNSRLYIAQDECMYHSDAGNPGVMDTRHNFFTFGGGINMMLAVKDGFYISHENKISWHKYLGEVEIKGSNIKIPDFDYRDLLDVPAIKGSSVPIEIMKLGGNVSTKDSIVGRCIIFSTSIGIFMGLPGGYIKDLTSDHYAVNDIEDGSSMIKWHNGYRQYIFLGQIPSGIGLINLDVVDGADSASLTA